MFLEISQNSQENTCDRVSFFLVFLLKKRLWQRCFPVNFVKLLRTLFHRIPLAAASELIIYENLKSNICHDELIFRQVTHFTNRNEQKWNDEFKYSPFLFSNGKTNSFL